MDVTVELAPWVGGFYERIIGTIKRALRKSIGKIYLTEDQIETILADPEARPLVYVREDFGS